MTWAPANVVDLHLLEATLDAMVESPPIPTPEHLQHLCLDKGYDARSADEIAENHGYVAHIARKKKKGQPETIRLSEEARHPARRWVVERTFAWLSKFRALLVRYDCKPENYAGMCQLACALIWVRIWHRLKHEQAVG